MPTQHIVMFDSDGSPVDPTGNIGDTRHSPFFSYPKMPADDYDRYLENLFKHITAKPLQGGTRKILFYVHGGLNTQVNTLERVVQPVGSDNTKLYEAILNGGYYPIFVNWKSSLWSSYFEHLFSIRQGTQVSVATGLATSFVVFPVDVGRSILRLPLTWGTLVANDAKTIYNISKAPSFADEVGKEGICRAQYGADLSGCLKTFRFQTPPYCIPFAADGEQSVRPAQRSTAAPKSVSVEIGEDQRRCLEGTPRFLMYLATIPSKFLIAPI